MSNHALLTCLPLLGFLLLAAIVDVRKRRIPNMLTLVLAGAGLALSFTRLGLVGPWSALAGLGVGFGLTLALFILGALGGGDVKLLAGVGAWIGPWPVLAVFLAAAVVGLVLVIAQSLWSGRLKVLFQNSALLVVNLVHVRQVGVEHVSRTGKSCRSVDKPLPYAVPVLVATLLVLLAPAIVGR